MKEYRCRSPVHPWEPSDSKPELVTRSLQIDHFPII